MDNVLYISLSTGFSISFPSTITSPVLASSKIFVIFFALSIFSFEGEKTLFKSLTWLGCIDPLPENPKSLASVACSILPLDRR